MNSCRWSVRTIGTVWLWFQPQSGSQHLESTLKILINLVSFVFFPTLTTDLTQSHYRDDLRRAAPSDRGISVMSIQWLWHIWCLSVSPSVCVCEALPCPAPQAGTEWQPASRFHNNNRHQHKAGMNWCKQHMHPDILLIYLSQTRLQWQKK